MNQHSKGKRILIIGSSGFIGSALTSFLRRLGHEIIRAVRHPKQVTKDTILWNPEKDSYRLEEFENFDVVINLAGENIASLRWTEAKKRAIYESRIKTTKLLSEILLQLKNPPSILINGSATGYYGNQHDQVLTEEAQNGTGFLAKVCRDWEKEALKASQKGIRVVLLRTSVVLSVHGGALSKMLTPFKLGLGGIFGSGKQYMSWITIEDLLRVILFAIEHKELQGPINASTPYPVKNEQFTKTLGKLLNRPTFCQMPEFLIRFILVYKSHFTKNILGLYPFYWSMKL